MWYLAVGLAARGWESHNLEIWWNSDSFFVSFEVTLSGSRVPGYIKYFQKWYTKHLRSFSIRQHFFKCHETFNNRACAFKGVY